MTDFIEKNCQKCIYYTSDSLICANPIATELAQRTVEITDFFDKVDSQGVWDFLEPLDEFLSEFE